MRDENLPSPGLYSNGQRLRRECATAISFAEVQADRAGGTNPSADVLASFFDACRVAAAAVGDSPAAPAVSDTQAIVEDAQVITITGGTVTLSIVDGVIGGIFTAE